MLATVTVLYPRSHRTMPPGLLCYPWFQPHYPNYPLVLAPKHDERKITNHNAAVIVCVCVSLMFLALNKSSYLKNAIGPEIIALAVGSAFT